MTKKCNNCKHTWGVATYSCPRCGSSDIQHINDDGPKAAPTWVMTPEIKAWYDRTKKFVKKET